MKALIIGGAGFIGCNIAQRLIQEGAEVWILDNLSRKGTQSNLKWLQGRGEVHFIEGDIRRFAPVRAVFRKHRDFDVVYHMAAQVAVTTSVSNPREDFEINALGTFNVLEGIRVSGSRPILIFASTNKVYGGMEDVKVVEKDGRYMYENIPAGIPEDRMLDFHSPYGCSKGAADQYVRDYARIYGLRTITFRQSCIYGYRQFGVEDQGWVAWFTIQAVLNRPITIYGDGKQVRDMLFIDDLINAYQTAIQHINVTDGKIYNIGGGPSNTMCLHDLVNYLERLSSRKLKLNYEGWRPGDQPVFVSDIHKAKQEINWEPLVNPEQGVLRLYTWVSENQALILSEGL